jgi:hypothetical protein
MHLIIPLRAYAIALFACLALPANAMAAFSLAVAETAHKATAGQDAAVPAFPTGDGCDNATTDSGKIACTTKAIAGAASYCNFVAGGFVKDESWWSRARIPILVISVASTALGVSTIASAKSWAAVGGSTGIASGWNADSTAVSNSDDARLSSIKDSVSKLAGLDLTDLKSFSTALSIAAQCRAAAGSSSSTQNNAKPQAPKPAS